MVLQIIDNNQEEELGEKRKIVEKEEATNQIQLQQLQEQKQNPLMIELQEKLVHLESKLEEKEECSWRKKTI